MALKVGAKLVFNSDAHQPDDLINENKAGKVLLGCGISDLQVKDVFKNSEGLIKKVR